MRVKSIGLDIVVGDQCDGFELMEDVANELEHRGFRVVGADFKEDVTDWYEKNCPKALEYN